AELRQQEARAIEQREARRKAVLEVSRLFSERLGRAEALSVAIEAPASREGITRLKQLYDDAEAAPAVVRQEGLLLMREALLESDFESFRSDIDVRLVRQRMRPLRECVDRASAQALAGADGAAVLRDCRPAQLLAESRGPAVTLSATGSTTWRLCPRPTPATRMRTRSEYALRREAGSATPAPESTNPSPRSTRSDVAAAALT